MCMYKRVHLKSKSQHSVTWSAAVWPLRRLCCRPTVFLCHLRITALSLPTGNIQRAFQKCYLFFFACLNIALILNCVNRGFISYLKLWRPFTVNVGRVRLPAACDRWPYSRRFGGRYWKWGQKGISSKTPAIHLTATVLKPQNRCVYYKGTGIT